MTINPASVDIKDYLLTVPDLELEFVDNLFIGREPTTPDNCVTIFDTPGFGREKFYDRGIAYYKPSIQIRVRNTNYMDGWTLINSITEILHNQAMIINGMEYTAMFCTIEPAPLGYDANSRPRFVVTFDLQRSPEEMTTWEHIAYKTWLDIIK